MMKETLHVYVYRNKNNRFGKVKPYVGGLLQNAPTIATIFFKLETMDSEGDSVLEKKKCRNYPYMGPLFWCEIMGSNIKDLIMSH